MNEQALVIQPPVDDDQIQPASLDVCINESVVDPYTGEKETTDVIEIEPQQFLLANTVERIELPSFLAAQLTGRSSIGRKGVVVHATAGWIDPGFRGRITLEMYNMSEQTVRFECGDRVAQLVFFPLSAPAAEPYDGQYQDQEDPEI